VVIIACITAAIIPVKCKMAYKNTWWHTMIRWRQAIHVVVISLQIL
jgi:hypothetical protein